MKEFLSIKEVAEYLGVDYKTIYRLVQQAAIPAGKVGGVYRIRRQEVEAYFQRQQQALAEGAAKAADLKCGRCLRIVTPPQVVGICGAPDCDEPLCRACWEDDPDHRCRHHIVSRQARLRQAEAQLAKGDIPLLLTCEDARQRELLYLSRVEAKLRDRDEIPHPLSDRPVRVSDWSAVETRVEELDRFREAVAGYLDEVESLPLPTNPRHTYRLARDLVLEVAVYSDLATHLKQGFVTRPTTHTELFELLGRAIGRAEEEDGFTALGLAATAGWEKAAVDLILGDGANQRPFYHRLVAPVLVDLVTDRILFSRADKRLDKLALLFSPVVTMDVIQEVMTRVEALFSAGRTGVLLSELVEREQVPAAQVAAAFDRLAARGGYRVEDVDKRDRLLLRRSA